ncbi:MAG: hypothetical protein AAFO81_15325 [Pseudomonadota bacterium]
MSVATQLLDDLRCVATPQMRFIATATAKNADSAVQLGAEAVAGGVLQGLKFNAVGSTSVLAGCEWWCRTVNDGGDPGAAQCLAALQLPRAAMAELLLIEDAWLSLQRQDIASTER